jgi:hypothetical protein
LGLGAPECHPRRRRSSNTVHQTIDIWSLACVFSIAATWVALGYQGILQYAEFRKNAIKNLKAPNPSQLEASESEETSISDDKKGSEDCFHNGHEVLLEVKDWHKSLRLILRKTDTVTALVLDLIDKRMLLSDPTKRLSAEEACTELRRIYQEGQEAQSKLDGKVPEIITHALRQLDDSAPPKALPKTPSEESSPDLHSRNAKSKRLEEPLKKTTHRSEVFKPEPHLFSQRLIGIDESETAETSISVPTDVNHRQIQDPGVPEAGMASDTIFPQLHIRQPMDRPYSITNTTDPSIYEPPPPRSPANKPRAPPQSVFDARQKLDQSQKGIIGKARKLLRKHPKDEVLSRHFIDRDLVSLPQKKITRNY